MVGIYRRTGEVNVGGALHVNVGGAGWYLQVAGAVQACRLAIAARYHLRTVPSWWAEASRDASRVSCRFTVPKLLTRIQHV